MRTFHIVIVSAALTLGCGKPAPGPEEVARQYLEIGSTGDLAKAKDLVDPACYETKVGDVDAVKMMGARMTVSSIELTPVEVTDDKAHFSAKIAGSVEARESTTETSILGKPVTVAVSGLSIANATLTESLRLAKLDGAWKVTCPEANR